MDFVLDENLWDLVLWCVVLGAFGGLAWDVIEPIRMSGESTSTGFENRVTLPRVPKNSKAFDLGFIGPMLVGAAAALAAVFLISVSRPAAPSVENVSSVVEKLKLANISDQVIEDLELGETPPATANREQVIAIALIAGFAGPAVLRALRTRLVDLISSVQLNAVQVAAEKTKPITEKKLAEAYEATPPGDEVAASTAGDVADQVAEQVVSEAMEQLALKA